MASLIWSSVWLLLMAELVVTTVLVIPVPRKIRNWIARKVQKVQLGDRFGRYAYVLLLLLLLALVESMHSVHTIEEKMKYDKDRRHDLSYERLQTIMDHHRERRFRSQRNMYIAGFSFTLMFVIGRITTLMQESIELENEIERLHRQNMTVDETKQPAPNKDKNKKGKTDKPDKKKD